MQSCVTCQSKREGETEMKSILQDEKECWVCGNTLYLHEHHIFGGGLRPVSDREGFVVYLCAKHHNMSDEGVHFNPELNRGLRVACQSEYERTHTREEWMKLIGRNYL